MGAVIYCESGFQFKCFVRHVEINRCRCYSNEREVGELLGIREKGVFLFCLYRMLVVELEMESAVVFPSNPRD